MKQTEKGLDGIRLEEKLFPAADASLPELSDWIEAALEEAGCGLKASLQILVAAEEIFTNIAHYAYPGKTGEAAVGLAVTGGKCILRFSDSGIPFDPLQHKDPDLTPDAQERVIGGLGIFMVKKTMDDVTYAFREGKNILTLVKTIAV